MKVHVLSSNEVYYHSQISSGVILNLIHGVQQCKFMIKQPKEVKLQNREFSV
jgi:hypothetical protein